MAIYGTFVITALTIAILLMFFRKETKWWELLIPIAVSVVVVLGSLFLAEYVAVTDTEYWGHLGATAVHEEPYSYMSTCVETYPCGSDSKGNIQYCTRTYPCEQYVSRSCYLKFKRYDKSIRISFAKYKQLDQRWKHNGYNFKQVHSDLHNRPHHGGRHIVRWDGKWETAEPIVQTHRYENRVQASDSSFNFPDVDLEDIKNYGLYEYPEVPGGYEMVAVLDHGKSWKVDKYFRYLNGKLGPERRVRLWVAVFRDKPLLAAKLQEAYWKGSNKNEFVFCIGTDKEGKVTWGHIISWSEVHALKIEARNYISEMGELNEESMTKLAKWAETNVGSRFIKKDFRDFDHLRVTPPTYMIVISYILVLLANVGIAIFVVKNSYHDRYNRW